MVCDADARMRAVNVIRCVAVKLFAQQTMTRGESLKLNASAYCSVQCRPTSSQGSKADADATQLSSCVVSAV